MACVQQAPVTNIDRIHPHDLASKLHQEEPYVLVDCRPVLAYNSCHIHGAVNVNFTGMMKKRFMAGKISIADLVTTEEGRERFMKYGDYPTVVYDEATTDVQCLSANHSLILVISALTNMGRSLFLLEGGLTEFGSLHPSLCEVSVPTKPKGYLPPPPKATTPGQRDQALDWQTAPPVHVLSFLVLGSEKDAKSNEVFEWLGIQRVLNVTPSCPNQHEGKGVIYKRIPVSDTGTQKLSNKFEEAFEFIEDARVNNAVILIHCMAGISRSVTLTIAYLMAHFAMSMQDAYQFVKDKRPAISPNLNFMGQLVEFERELNEKPRPLRLNISDYVPRKDQLEVSEKLLQYIARRSNSITGGLPGISELSKMSPTKVQSPSPDKVTAANQQPFLLKPLREAKGRRGKKFKEILDAKENSPESEQEKKTETISTTHGNLPCPLPGTSQSAPIPRPLINDVTSDIENLTIKGEQKSLHERPVSPSRLPERKMMNEVTPTHSNN